jgi:hypothetical protein
VSKTKELMTCYGADQVKNQPSQFWKEPSHASGSSFQRDGGETRGLFFTPPSAAGLRPHSSLPDSRPQTWKPSAAGGVAALAFGARGEWLLVGHTDGSVVLWDVLRRALVKHLPTAHAAAVVRTPQPQRIPKYGFSEWGERLYDLELNRRAVVVGYGKDCESFKCQTLLFATWSIAVQANCRTHRPQKLNA